MAVAELYMKREGKKLRTEGGKLTAEGQRRLPEIMQLLAAERHSVTREKNIAIG